MCLIVFSYRQYPDYPLVLAANRDEFYDRPTMPVSFWPDHPGVLAGRDLSQGGTWLGVDRRGRFGAITNYRDRTSRKREVISRGALVREFLTGTEPPKEYIRRVHTQRERYNGFNLLIGDAKRLYYYSSHTGRERQLGPGLYGLSNHLLDTPWPKVEIAKSHLGEVLEGGLPQTERLLALLGDRRTAPDERLPNTGVGIEWERFLSPVFITSPNYGTRSSTVLLISRCGTVTLTERSFDENSAMTEAVSQQFTIQSRYNPSPTQ